MTSEAILAPLPRSWGMLTRGKLKVRHLTHEVTTLGKHMSVFPVDSSRWAQLRVDTTHQPYLVNQLGCPAQLSLQVTAAQPTSDCDCVRDPQITAQLGHSQISDPQNQERGKKRKLLGPGVICYLATLPTIITRSCRHNGKWMGLWTRLSVEMLLVVTKHNFKTLDLHILVVTSLCL